MFSISWPICEFLDSKIMEWACEFRHEITDFYFTKFLLNLMALFQPVANSVRIPRGSINVARKTQSLFDQNATLLKVFG